MTAETGKAAHNVISEVVTSITREPEIQEIPAIHPVNQPTAPFAPDPAPPQQQPWGQSVNQQPLQGAQVQQHQPQVQQPVQQQQQQPQVQQPLQQQQQQPQVQQPLQQPLQRRYHQQEQQQEPFYQEHHQQQQQQPLRGGLDSYPQQQQQQQLGHQLQISQANQQAQIAQPQFIQPQPIQQQQQQPSRLIGFKRPYPRKPTSERKPVEGSKNRFWINQAPPPEVPVNSYRVSIGRQKPGLWASPHSFRNPDPTAKDKMANVNGLLIAKYEYVLDPIDKGYKYSEVSGLGLVEPSRWGDKVQLTTEESCRLARILIELLARQSIPLEAILEVDISD